MNIKEAALRSILKQGILPLFYHDSFSISIEVISTMYKAGVRALEYTNRGTIAFENFRKLKAECKHQYPDLFLGIGTIKTGEASEQFIELGADFIVSPIIDEKVYKSTLKEGLLWIPGAMTPTEIHSAQQFEAKIIKIFPANILRPEFISSIRDIFPGQLFIPTGGVEILKENINSWFNAGACAVGVGSKLITKEILESGDYDLLFDKTKKALNLINAARS